MERINSAADNAFETSDSPAGSTSMNYSVSADGANPTINTVSEQAVGPTPSPNSGQTALPSVKTVNLPDTGGDKIRSAA